MDAVDLGVVWTPLRPVAGGERPAGMAALHAGGGIAPRAGDPAGRPLDGWPAGKHLVPARRPGAREVDVGGGPRRVGRERVGRGPAAGRQPAPTHRALGELGERAGGTSTLSGVRGGSPLAGAPSTAPPPPCPRYVRAKAAHEPRVVRDAVRLEGRAARGVRAGVGRRDHLRLAHGAPSSRPQLETRSLRRALLHGAGPHARHSRGAHGPEGGVVGARRPPM